MRIGAGGDGMALIFILILCDYYYVHYCKNDNKYIIIVYNNIVYTCMRNMYILLKLK